MIHKHSHESPKPLFWVGDTKEELSGFPTSVKRIFGQALFEAQCGRVHQDAKPMKGNLRSVLEICADDEGLAFRAVYTVKIGDVVYALSAFIKKSRKGVSTPKRHLDLIAQRLKEAQEHYERSCSKKGQQKGSRRDSAHRQAPGASFPR